MKFIEKSNGLYITGIDGNDLAWRNLGGRPRDDNPDKKDHYVDIKVSDTKLLEFLIGQGVVVKDAPDYKNPDVLNHVVRFKAYPKIKRNPITGKESAVPKVVIKVISTGDARQLDIPSFGEADSVSRNSKDISIKFHIFSSDYHGMHYIPSIDEYYCSVEEIDDSNEDYLGDMYGVHNMDPNEGDDDVPFV